MKHGVMLHNSKMQPLPRAYETEILVEPFKAIEIRPTFDTSLEERDEETESDVEKSSIESLSDQWYTKYSGISFS